MHGSDKYSIQRVVSFRVGGRKKTELECEGFIPFMLIYYKTTLISVKSRINMGVHYSIICTFPYV